MQSWFSRSGIISLYPLWTLFWPMHSKNDDDKNVMGWSVIMMSQQSCEQAILYSIYRFNNSTVIPDGMSYSGEMYIYSFWHNSLILYFLIFTTNFMQIIDYLFIFYFIFLPFPLQLDYLSGYFTEYTFWTKKHVLRDAIFL